MYFGEGLSYHGSILDAALSMNLEKSGSWYSYNNEKIGQGREMRLTSYVPMSILPKI